LRIHFEPIPHVGDFVGQHVIDGALDNRVAHLLSHPDDLLEDVAGEPSGRG
jgi:hypothetical protein